jgi:hypothetical protein
MAPLTQSAENDIVTDGTTALRARCFHGARRWGWLPGQLLAKVNAAVANHIGRTLASTLLADRLVDRLPRA